MIIFGGGETWGTSWGDMEQVDQLGKHRPTIII